MTKGIFGTKREMRRSTTRGILVLRKVSLVLMCVVLLDGCATPLVLPMTRYDADYQFKPTHTKGCIYIYRESEFPASRRGIYISANGKRIGGLNDGTYFVYEVDPGKVEVAAENTLERDASIKRTIAVEVGKKYYIRGSFKSGVWEVKPYIEIITEAEGEQAVRGLSYETLKTGR